MSTPAKKKKLNFDSPIKNTESPRKIRKESATEYSRKYFEFLYENIEDGIIKKYYKCILCDENSKPVNGTNPSNFVKHLQKHHSNEHQTVKSNRDKTPAENHLMLLQSMVEIVTVNGREFSYLYDSGFVGSIRDRLTILKNVGHGILMGDKNLLPIKVHIKKMASQVREKIKNEISNRPFSILVDIAKRNNRSFMGISAQFILNVKFTIRSLGIVQLEKSHTYDYLADVISNCLLQYDVDASQVITITTDNGSNMLKMVKEMDQNMQELSDVHANTIASHENSQSVSSIEQISIGSNDITNDFEIECILAQIDSNIDDDTALDILFEDHVPIDENVIASHDQLLMDITSTLSNRLGYDFHWKITGINCAVHTLQLAIKDAIHELPRKHNNVIRLSRLVAKKLRLKSTKNEMDEIQMTYKYPRIDQETRWGSLYLMVIRIYYKFNSFNEIMSFVLNEIMLMINYVYFLNYFQLSDVVKCENVIKHFAESGLTKNEPFKQLANKWAVLKEMVKVLGFPYSTTKSLQKRDLTLSDVYGEWLKLEITLKAYMDHKKNTKLNLAKNLLITCQQRKEVIFSNPLMNAAIFMDPRFRKTILTDETKVNSAKSTLEALWLRISALNHKMSQEISGVSNSSFNFDADAALDSYINNMTDCNDITPNTLDIERIEEILHDINMPSSVSIYDFWDSMKSHKNLYQLAMVIFGIPPTEVEIERDFSKLKLVFKTHRCNIDKQRLEDVLILHLNKELFFIVAEENIQSLKKEVQEEI